MNQLQPHSIPDASAFELQAEYCRAMGHPIRLLILHHLHDSGGELPSAEILHRVGVTKAGLSQHLAKMANVGLIRTRRDGRFLHVELACPEVGQACEMVRSALGKEARFRAESLG